MFSLFIKSYFKKQSVALNNKAFCYWKQKQRVSFENSWIPNKNFLGLKTQKLDKTNLESMLRFDYDQHVQT